MKLVKNPPSDDDDESDESTTMLNNGFWNAMDEFDLTFVDDVCYAFDDQTSSLKQSLTTMCESQVCGGQVTCHLRDLSISYFERLSDISYGVYGVQNFLIDVYKMSRFL